MSNTKKSDEIFISEFEDSSQTVSDSWSESSVHREQDENDSSPRFHSGAQINDRYLLQRVLGYGEISVVWLARDLHAETPEGGRRYLAIKVLKEAFKDDPDVAGALHRELELTSALTHPNIADVWGVERSGEDYFMTMEYLAGVTLDQAMQRYDGQGFPKDTALEIFSYISAGLEYAHSCRIVHADFNPSNIFLTRDGQVRILNFGIAGTADKLARKTGGRKLFDAAKQKTVSPAYTSCETLEGADPDVRNDVYALACVAYQLFSGRHPFAYLSATEARDQGLMPRAIAGLSQKQNEALRQGLAFAPRGRTASVRQFVRGLNPPRKRSWRIATTVVTAVALFVPVAILFSLVDLRGFAIGAFEKFAESTETKSVLVSDSAAPVVITNSDDQIGAEAQPLPRRDQEQDRDQEQIQVQSATQESRPAPIVLDASVREVPQSPATGGSENYQVQKEQQIAEIRSGFSKAIAQPEMSLDIARRLVDDLDKLAKLGEPVDADRRKVEDRLIEEVRRLAEVEGFREAIEFAGQAKIVTGSGKLATLEAELIDKRYAPLAR
jgi:serine/threonine protein kinase